MNTRNDLAGGFISRINGRSLDRHFADIQSQISLSASVISTVAVPAMIGKDRLDIASKIDVLDRGLSHCPVAIKRQGQYNHQRQ